MKKMESPLPDQGKQSAKRSSFYNAMGMAPTPEQTDAIIRVYAFCRNVDDIADSSLPQTERLEMLGNEMARLERCYGDAPPADLILLHHYIHRYNLPKAEFKKLFAGMLSDIRGETIIPSRSLFDLYVDNVSCSIGRIVTKILKIDEEVGAKLSHHAGIAMQLTNILRDVDDDLVLGFCYLPRDVLNSCGIYSSDLLEIRAHSHISCVFQALTREAYNHYRLAYECLMQNSISSAVVREMIDCYIRILDNLSDRAIDSSP